MPVAVFECTARTPTDLLADAIGVDGDGARVQCAIRVERLECGLGEFGVVLDVAIRQPCATP